MRALFFLLLIVLPIASVEARVIWGNQDEDQGLKFYVYGLDGSQIQDDYLAVGTMFQNNSGCERNEICIMVKKSGNFTLSVIDHHMGDTQEFSAFEEIAVVASLVINPEKPQIMTIEVFTTVKKIFSQVWYWYYNDNEYIPASGVEETSFFGISFSELNDIIVSVLLIVSLSSIPVALAVIKPLKRRAGK